MLQTHFEITTLRPLPVQQRLVNRRICKPSLTTFEQINLFISYIRRHNANSISSLGPHAQSRISAAVSFSPQSAHCRHCNLLVLIALHPIEQKLCTLVAQVKPSTSTLFLRSS